jgi:methyl-accepting chemotaxis protein
MGAKGPLDVVLDIPAVNEIIVFANQYKAEVSEHVSAIRSLCKQMTDNESLNGGDGEEIKANFVVISNGCSQLESSIEKIVTILNQRLEKMIQMNKGKTTAEATEAANKAAKNMNIIKE